MSQTSRILLTLLVFLPCGVLLGFCVFCGTAFALQLQSLVLGSAETRIMASFVLLPKIVCNPSFALCQVGHYCLKTSPPPNVKYYQWWSFHNIFHHNNISSPTPFPWRFHKLMPWWIRPCNHQWLFSFFVINHFCFNRTFMLHHNVHQCKNHLYRFLSKMA